MTDLRSGLEEGYFQNVSAGVELVCRGSGVYPLHSHVSIFTAGTALEGVVSVSDGRGVRPYRRGQVFVLPPRAPHSVRVEGRLLSLCLRSDVPGSPARTDSARALLERTLGPALSEMLLCRILSLGRQPPFSTDPFLTALAERISAHPEARLNLDEMARAACLSKYELIRRFKSTAGLTPHQFLLQNRIRKGQRLLSQSATVAAAAQEAGFYDQSHFVRQFQRCLGLTPAAYKAVCQTL